MRIGLLITGAALSCIACSAESTPPMRMNASQGPSCVAGSSRSCVCSSGTGTEACNAAGAYDACVCEAGQAPVDVGNPDPSTPVVDAGPVQPARPTRDCSPGFYLGTYDCELTIGGFPVPLMGDVSFNLSINEMTVDQECETGEEFCADLVISENGGTLFGIGAGFWGFETMLQGALDCTTGEFRAMGIDGRWGAAISSDPNDPNALWTVEDPPLGVFDGLFMGTHETATSETISGTWDLIDHAADLRCAGPFSVTLQP
jgi:hypothetical protein